MTLKILDHVNIRTANLPDLTTWYSTVLGMKSGRRPPFPFPGAWMYVGENAVVHLVAVDKELAANEPKLEHFAFSATDLKSFLDRLKVNDVAYTLDPVPDFPVVQVNLRDSDGNHIHVDFSTDELADIEET